MTVNLLLRVEKVCTYGFIYVYVEVCMYPDHTRSSGLPASPFSSLPKLIWYAILNTFSDINCVTLGFDYCSVYEKLQSVFMHGCVFWCHVGRTVCEGVMGSGSFDLLGCGGDG